MTERRRDDQSTSVREIEFNVSNASYPFVAVSEKANCRIELVEMLPNDSGQYVEFFTVADADPSQILDYTDPYDTDIRLLSERSNGGLFEFHVSAACPVITLAELGALPRIVRADDGSGRIVAGVPPRRDEVAIVDEFLAENPNAELAAKREKDNLEPLFSQTAFRQELYAALTERQHEVLKSAFEAGYYDWPRKCSGEDVAAELGITSPTFSQHIHAAERKLLTLLFEEPQADFSHD
ncbi:bacterio-opsin activator domain-containing protein [Natrinema halophilum]|uniref:Helix-turn-helix domain-containing protein n=1 Tax=Natrinema halophilum TaxID=1699371 RepID=A0A7D5GSC2_9EURY|nr:bacterio-opsin activator domain-containing protein [Natrinema halophilum]QLG49169.1 helix-turn-helix domain-containing protein [Natrinema halophilum]